MRLCDYGQHKTSSRYPIWQTWTIRCRTVDILCLFCSTKLFIGAAYDDGSNVSQQCMYTTVNILSSIKLFIQAAYDVGRYS